MKTCACCKDGKPGATGGKNGYRYNRLEGKTRKWAQDNGVARSEFCVRVKDGKRFGGPDWQKDKCGDGRMGFSTKKGSDEVRVEQGLDNQWKRKRATLLNKRSVRATTSRKVKRIDGSRCGLISPAILVDPSLTAQYRQMILKNRFRGVNRNKVRRAAKCNTRSQVIEMNLRIGGDNQ